MRELKKISLSAEQPVVMEALRKTGGNKLKAAKLLGIDRKTLYNKLRSFHKMGTRDAPSYEDMEGWYLSSMQKLRELQASYKKDVADAYARGFKEAEQLREKKLRWAKI